MLKSRGVVWSGEGGGVRVDVYKELIEVFVKLKKSVGVRSGGGGGVRVDV